MVKWLIVGFLLVPVAEIAIFVAVAAIIGVAWALVLMLSTSLAGALVLRQAGRRRIAGFRVAVADSDSTAIEANTGGFLMVLAGPLLFLPGFLTDLAGMALLIGPVRRRCGAAFRQAVRSRARDSRTIVDLAPGEWRQVGDPQVSDPRVSGPERKAQSEKPKPDKTRRD